MGIQTRQLFALSLIISFIGSLQDATSESVHGGSHCDISKEGSDNKCAGLLGDSPDKWENGDRIDIESGSGLEFLREGHNIVSDEITFGDPAYLKHQQDETNFSVLEHVIEFIRTMKGLPAEKLSDHNFGSGDDLSSKPAWCYFPYRLANLVKIEIKIYELFKKFSRRMGDEDVFPAFDSSEERNKILLSYLDDIEESSLRVLNYPEHFLTNELAEKDPYLYVAT